MYGLTKFALLFRRFLFCLVSQLYLFCIQRCSYSACFDPRRRRSAVRLFNPGTRASAGPVQSIGSGSWFAHGRISYSSVAWNQSTTSSSGSPIDTSDLISATQAEESTRLKLSLSTDKLSTRLSPFSDLDSGLFPHPVPAHASLGPFLRPRETLNHHPRVQHQTADETIPKRLRLRRLPMISGAEQTALAVYWTSVLLYAFVSWQAIWQVKSERSPRR
jgi:hypothetical protein